jgi:hypothetical protein
VGKTQSQPLSQTLQACAQELAAWADRCETLQAGLSPVLQNKAAIEEAQILDLMTQSLGAMADYLKALAAGLPADWRVDAAPAAAILPLAELARRLSGGAGDRPSEAGDLDLFGGRQ